MKDVYMKYFLIAFFIFWILLNNFLRKLFKASLHKDNPIKETRFFIILSLVLFVISFTSLMIFKHPYGVIGIFLLIQSAVSYSFGRNLIKTKKMT